MTRGPLFIGVWFGLVGLTAAAADERAVDDRAVDDRAVDDRADNRAVADGDVQPPAPHSVLLLQGGGGLDEIRLQTALELQFAPYGIAVRGRPRPQDASQAEEHARVFGVGCFAAVWHSYDASTRQVQAFVLRLDQSDGEIQAVAAHRSGVTAERDIAAAVRTLLRAGLTRYARKLSPPAEDTRLKPRRAAEPLRKNKPISKAQPRSRRSAEADGHRLGLAFGWWVGLRPLGLRAHQHGPLGAATWRLWRGATVGLSGAFGLPRSGTLADGSRWRFSAWRFGATAGYYWRWQRIHAGAGLSFQLSRVAFTATAPASAEVDSGSVWEVGWGGVLDGGFFVTPWFRLGLTVTLQHNTLPFGLRIADTDTHRSGRLTVGITPTLAVYLF